MFVISSLQILLAIDFLIKCLSVTILSDHKGIAPIPTTKIGPSIYFIETIHKTFAEKRDVKGHLETDMQLGSESAVATETWKNREECMGQ